MTDQRGARRYNRKLHVRFGERELDRSGFTSDISATGMFIASVRLPALQTRIHIQVQMDGGQAISYEGLVQRHFVVPVELKAVAKGGFGVSFLRPEQLLTELMPSLADHTVHLAFATPADLKKVMENELRHGGLFVRTEKGFSRDDAVTVEIHLGWANRSVLFDAQVLHVVGGATNSRGLGLLLKDTATARALLESALA